VSSGLCREDADELTSMLSNDILQLRMDNLVEQTDIANLGVAMWGPGDTVCDVLSKADIALRSAQSAGENAWSRYEPPAGDHATLRGIRQWYDYLSGIIENGDIILHCQPVSSCDNLELLHKEVLPRIKEANGQYIAAGIFMPMAERLGIASELDKLVIGKLLEYLASGAPGNSTYAVNLATTSLHDTAFVEWLCKLIAEHPDYAPAIIFEFPEYAVMKNLRLARNAIRRLIKAGCGCGIDHFGHGFNSFGYLSSINVQYLKLDGSYIHGIETGSDNRFFIQALTNTAHSIEIKVIAESVETAAQLEVVRTLNIDAMQGYLSGKPVPVQGCDTR
jgi:EAL domain-containing protein (putative c-di-GMP-specific phosphodiesterase class I)